jgi:alpha-beta hydrolase superfamily lysophospholipase
MDEADFRLATDDGWEVVARLFTGTSTDSGVIQIAHGAAEHSARYRRVAEVLVDAGYVVAVNDHRGHGTNAKGGDSLGVARPGGWEAILTDMHSLTKYLGAQFPARPLVLFGHSMGSMLTQQYLPRWGADLDGAILSGTSAAHPRLSDLATMLEAALASDGADAPSEIFGSRFARYNDPWDGPGATGFEWLSRDEAEVALYADDPWCGHRLSNGFVRDMFVASAEFAASGALSSTPSDLPIYIFSGDHDPVGGELGRGVVELADQYRAAGVGSVSLKLYKGGRHEMLNETNRDEVHQDILDWLTTLSGA